jgi:hypothetical protein
MILFLSAGIRELIGLAAEAVEGDPPPAAVLTRRHRPARIPHRTVVETTI